jgi:hypothetical protein
MIARVVVRSDLDATMSQDRSRVDAFVDDEPLSTMNSVQPVTMTSCSRASRAALHAGKRRQQRMVRVQVPPLEAGEEPRADQFHEATHNLTLGSGT